MSNRDAYAPGVPSWVATVQPDPPAAARFYAGVFGWDLAPRDDYVIARLRGRDVAAIAPLPPGMEPAPSAAWVTHVEVESAEATADRVRAAGGEGVGPARGGGPPRGGGGRGGPRRSRPRRRGRGGHRTDGHADGPHRRDRRPDRRPPRRQGAGPASGRRDRQRVRRLRDEPPRQ